VTVRKILNSLSVFCGFELEKKNSSRLLVGQKYGVNLSSLAKVKLDLLAFILSCSTLTIDSPILKWLL